jgi:hypothetical protein
MFQYTVRVKKGFLLRSECEWNNKNDTTGTGLGLFS